MPDEGARPLIAASIEGATDEAVVRRLIDHAGGRVKNVHGRMGKGHLRQKIASYNNAARHWPWIVLVDLDSEMNCAVQLREAWLPEPAPLLCFRIAVREVEAWLMADPETLADYLDVPRGRVPDAPEGLDDPKGAMAALARRSRRRDIREDMAPREGSGRRMGPAYPARLIEYAANAWRPEVAARNAESLRRAVACLRRLVANLQEPREA